MINVRGCQKISQGSGPKLDTFGVSTKSPSYRELNKGSIEGQGPTLGVRFTEMSILWRCPLRQSQL